MEVEYTEDDLNSIISRVEKSVKAADLKRQIIDLIQLHIIQMQLVDMDSEETNNDSDERIQKLENLIDKIRRGTSCEWTRSLINSR